MPSKRFADQADCPEAQRFDLCDISLGDISLNAVHYKPQPEKADLLPLVFIHGASASLYDPLIAFGKKLQGRADMVFVDRPGHGASDLGDERYITPDAQADAIALLLKRLGIKRAIIIGHSYGGAVTAALALRHPHAVAGLLFLSPALYPWPGGISWHYTLANVPVLGQAFSTIVVPVFGPASTRAAIEEVFAPNPVPEHYSENTRVQDALRPAYFRRNAAEVAALNAWAKKASPFYKQIKAKTIIISGMQDKVVAPDIHARHLARDVARAKLFMFDHLGHKPDYIVTDFAIAALETLSGRKQNLHAMAAAIDLKA